MKLVERIAFRKGKATRKITFFLGMPIFQCVKKTKNLKTKKYYSFVFNSCKPKKGQRIFYLKVHRVHKTSFDCIKQWIEVANNMNAFIYFVCDNPLMEKEIKKKLNFFNFNFKFIKSDRKTLKPEILKILNKVERAKMWQRIAYSMLTPFIHANKNKFNLSYNIDADDILLCINPKKISEAFYNAEKYAKENNLDLFNLDMFYSKSFGVHWSFGVVMCTNPANCIDAIKKNTNWRTNIKFKKNFNICWIDKFNFNIDWFFTYLRDTKQLNMKTFYIENAMVAHMPDYILEHGWAFLIKWKNNTVHFPILSDFYNRKIWNNIPIPTDTVKIDINLSENCEKDFLRNFYDFGVAFEKSMLNYAQIKSLISEDLYKKYSTSPQFLREISLEKTKM